MHTHKRKQLLKIAWLSCKMLVTVCDGCAWGWTEDWRCADEQGFVSINDCLACAGGPSNVFAVGDVAQSVASPRPKAGVFAVRQGPPLANNIRRSA